MRLPEQQHPALNDTPETHRDQQTRAVQECAIPTLQRYWKADNETLKTTCELLSNGNVRPVLIPPSEQSASKWVALQIIAPYNPKTSLPHPAIVFSGKMTRTNGFVLQEFPVHGMGCHFYFATL